MLSHGKAVFLHFKIREMKKSTILAATAVVLMSSCANEFNRVYKYADTDYRYEYAKQCFAKGKFTNAVTLLQDVVTAEKGTENAQESLYLLGMAEYCGRDYESASATFKKYCSSYPKGFFAEQASYYIGESLYERAPEPRLDQTPTIGALNAYQNFLDMYPDSKLRKTAQNRLFELQDKLVSKEYLSAELYYHLGGYFGNCTSGGSNYEACIITAENALKNYPYSKRREDFSVLVMKSKFELAQQSVAERVMERYRDAEDECYGFINEYPDSKERSTAENYIAKCKKYTGD